MSTIIKGWQRSVQIRYKTIRFSNKNNIFLEMHFVCFDFPSGPMRTVAQMCYNVDNVLAYILKLTTETIFVLFILTKCLDCLLSMLTGIVNLLQPNRPVIRPTDSSRKTLNKLRTLISKVLWLLRAEPIFLFPQRIFVGKLVHKMDQNFKWLRIKTNY